MYKILILGNGFHINISREFQFSNFVHLDFDKAKMLLTDVKTTGISEKLLQEVLRSLISDFRNYNNLSFMYNYDVEAFLSGLIDSVSLDLPKKKQKKEILEKLFISWVWNTYKNNENKYLPDTLERLKHNKKDEYYDELIDFNYLNLIDEKDSLVNVTHPHGVFNSLENNPANNKETKIIISNTDKTKDVFNEVAQRSKLVSKVDRENIIVEIFGLSITNDGKELTELFKNINTSIVTITYYYFSYKDIENSFIFFQNLFKMKKENETENYIWSWEPNNDDFINQVKRQFSKSIKEEDKISFKEYESFLLEKEDPIISFKKLVNKPKYQHEPIISMLEKDQKISYYLKFKSYDSFFKE